MGKVTHRRRAPQSQGGGGCTQPVGLRAGGRDWFLRVLCSMEKSQNIVSSAFRARCGSENSPPAHGGDELCPQHLGCWVCRVISPPVCHWALQVLEIANSRWPWLDDRLWRQATGWQTANCLHVVSSWRVQPVLPLQAPVELSPLITSSPLPRAGPAEGTKTAVFFPVPRGAMY